MATWGSCNLEAGRAADLREPLDYVLFAAARQYEAAELLIGDTQWGHSGLSVPVLGPTCVSGPGSLSFSRFAGSRSPRKLADVCVLGSQPFRVSRQPLGSLSASLRARSRRRSPLSRRLKAFPSHEPRMALLPGRPTWARNPAASATKISTTPGSNRCTSR
jgi:hypothetical protein